MKPSSPTCYCGLPFFFDSDEDRFLCPARFDGEHTDLHVQAALLALNERHAEAKVRGTKGGTARANSLSQARRTEIARKAARTRWSASRK
jgi:hypothetical protein